MMDEENKNRTFKIKLLDKNKNLEKINKILDNIKDRKEIFVAFRNGSIQLYYKMTNIFKININKNEKLSISVRDKSKDEKVKKLTEEYKEIVEKLGFKEIKNNSFSTLKLDEVFEKDWNSFFEIVIAYIDELKLNDSELAIQNQYATKYNGKGELYIVDTEFKQYFSSKEEKDEYKTDIRGRYDMIALYNEKNKYKVVFIELKSNEKACINVDSGVINHIYDMNKYLNEYEKNTLNIKENTKEMIEFNLETKTTLKLLDFKSLDVNEVDFDIKPEFWVIYDFGNNEIKKYDNEIPYIYEEIEKYKKSKNKGKNLVNKNHEDFEKTIKNMRIKFFVGNISENELQEIKMDYKKNIN